MSRQDSGGEHWCLKEESSGFLRPSLEETLAFNRSRSVGEDEVAGVVGFRQIRFLMFSFCLSIVCLLFYPLICFYFSFVAGSWSSYQDSSFWERGVTSRPAQGMEAVETALRALSFGYVFHLGLKVAMGYWIFPG